MSVDYLGHKIYTLETSTFMDTLTCNPKWSQDEFNSQSHALHDLGRLHGPWCKRAHRVAHWNTLDDSLVFKDARGAYFLVTNNKCHAFTF